MPNGKTHALITSAIAIGVTGTALAFVDVTGPVVVTGLSVGAWLGLIVDPDLDLGAITTESEQKVLRFNRTLGLVWLWYWGLYGRMFAHRDDNTHSWPVGTLLRFIYCFWLMAPLSVVMGVAYLPEVMLFWICLFGGLSLPDIAHISTDRLSTLAKDLGLG